MAQQVNLDALIPREDFEVAGNETQSQQTSTIQIRDLESTTFFASALRKPDFQRETSEWDPDKILDFIQSFLSGDLIPALILWQSGENVFVIDGAHRLSALMAWVHDDYGDGSKSRNFFESRIPDEQKSVAEITRRKVNKIVGKYEEYQFAAANPTKVDGDLLTKARRLATLAISLQWVKGDAAIAEQSFFKINQQAAPINKTELSLLRARKKPHAIAARAIIRSGTGHKYWSKFEPDITIQIESLAKSIYELLFDPELETPIKTLDLPVAGKGYSARTLPLIYDFVSLVNSVPSEKNTVDDPDGSITIEYLKYCKKVLSRIVGTHPGSLGLHPAVYFYSDKGRYQPTAFLAMISMVCDLITSDKFVEFTTSRRNFEEFILKYKRIPNQVALKYGSGTKGFSHLKSIWAELISMLGENKNEKEMISSFENNHKFSYLTFSRSDSVDDSIESENFNTNRKSAIFLKTALENPMRCAICKGLIHKNGITIDHTIRKQDGGDGSIENGQLAHPYCNSTIKN